MSPHDTCVWNKIKMEKQTTIMFHIDDLMPSHELGTVVTKHVKLLDEVHGAKDHLTVTRGRTHECLGITIVKRGVDMT